MTPEFYRGGTRSPFSSMVKTGPLTFSSSGEAAIPISVATAGSQLRLKRIQAAVQLPDSAARTHGWFAFVRVPDDFTADFTSLTPAEPTVLRPKAILTNSDHATYWENYLEAINLDGGGALFLLLNLSGNVSGSTYSIRYTEERQLG